MRNLTAVIVAGGSDVHSSVLDEIPDSRWVVAADSGLDVARSLGLAVDVVVGDFDSASTEALAEFGGTVHRHPSDKDHTDLELALQLVGTQQHIERVIVVGGGGGRVDHLLGNIAVLGSPAYSHLRIEWLPGEARIHVVWDHVELHGIPGDVLSIIPLAGSAEGVTTTGLRWALDEATLFPHSSRGMSNELTRSIATVHVQSGCVLVIQPDVDPDQL